MYRVNYRMRHSNGREHNIRDRAVLDEFKLYRNARKRAVALFAEQPAIKACWITRAENGSQFIVGKILCR